MNEKQMQFLATEMADSLMTKLAPIFVPRELADGELELVKEALALSYLEGMGRAAKEILHGVRAATV